MNAAVIAGELLAHYRIVGVLGAGGMGQVYEAEDTRLGRLVALKVLSPERGLDPAARARFEREARIIAALDHPNIVAVYAVEQWQGRLFIVMERVRGRSLDQLIPDGGFALAELLRVALPLCEAVGAAHQQGITHRDLKPRNLMLGDDGRLKVLDFGLAKEGHAGDPGVMADTTETTLSVEGAVLGTVAYMSPEQAQGRPIDPRSDIYSLGVVLFEMATGTRPMAGDSTAALIAAILRDPPPPIGREGRGWQALERVIRRCLEKEPLRRYQSAIDLKLDLEEARALAAEGEPRPRGFSKRGAAGVAALGVALLGLGAGMVALRARRSLPVVVAAAADARGAGGPRIDRLRRLDNGVAPAFSPSLSPDGTWFVYAGTVAGHSDVFRQRVDGQNAMNLTADSPDDDEDPAISPDGQRIAFVSSRRIDASQESVGGIYLMGATGESATRVTTFGRHPSWSPDGTRIVFSTEKVQLDTALYSRTSECWTLTLATGELRKVAPAIAAQPSFSPHGLRIAYFGVDGHGVRDLWDVRGDGSDPVRLTDDAAIDWNPVWSPDGRWLYFASDRGGAMNLWRLPIDEQSGRGGTPEPVTLGAGARLHSMSFDRDGGRLVFACDTTRYEILRVPFDAARGLTSGPPELIGIGNAPAPYGDLIAYETVGSGSGSNLALSRLDGSGRRLLTDDRFTNVAPQWSPDGSRIAFRSDRDGQFQCWSIHPDGSGLMRLSDFAGGSEGRRCLFSPDGALMASRVAGGKVALFDPRVPRPGSGESPPRILAAPAAGHTFTPYAWSPDGRTLAGFDNVLADGTYDTRLLDVASGSYAPTAGQVIALPAWLDDSRRVLFQRRGQIELVDLRGGATHRVVADKNEGLGAFALSRDERWIYFEHIALDVDTWMATLK